MDDQRTLDTMWSMLEAQHARMEEQQVEIERLRAELRAQKGQPGQVEQLVARGGEICTSYADREDEIHPAPKVSRGRLIKLIVAGVAGAAGIGVLRPQTASACLEGSANTWYSAHGVLDDPCASQATGFVTEPGAAFRCGVAVAGGVVGVYGRAYTDSSQDTSGVPPSTGQYGVYGENTNANIYGEGVHGKAVGSGTGVYGESDSGVGVAGSSHSGEGVQGTAFGSQPAVLGSNAGSSAGAGVKGDSASGVGVEGVAHLSNYAAIHGYNVNDGFGIVGSSYTGGGTSSYGAGTAMWGRTGSGTGVLGDSATGPGVVGTSGHDYGVTGTTATPTSSFAGVYGLAQDQNGNNGPGIGVRGVSGTGAGVLGESKSSGSLNAAVMGRNAGSDPGVSGESSSGVGVRGSGATGVDGTGSTGPGVHGLGSPGVVGTAGNAASFGVLGKNLGSGAGVLGTSGSGTGVQGRGSTGVQGAGSGVAGRGGIFSGSAAQVNLTPSLAASHPAKGQRGDLFVDIQGRLWFCKTSSTSTAAAVWKQLA